MPDIRIIYLKDIARDWTAEAGGDRARRRQRSSTQPGQRYSTQGMIARHFTLCSWALRIV